MIERHEDEDKERVQKKKGTQTEETKGFESVAS
jgi:hypothetical protein